MDKGILFPVKKELLSPQDFLNTLESDYKNIEETRFIPPKLGQDGFGSFEVKYRTPKLKPVAGFGEYLDA